MSNLYKVNLTWKHPEREARLAELHKRWDKVLVGSRFVDRLVSFACGAATLPGMILASPFIATAWLIQRIWEAVDARTFHRKLEALDQEQTEILYGCCSVCDKTYRECSCEFCEGYK